MNFGHSFVKLSLVCLLSAGWCVTTGAARINEIYFDDPSGGWPDAVEVAGVSTWDTVELVVIDSRDTAFRGMVKQVVTFSPSTDVVLASDQTPTNYPWEPPGPVFPQRIAPPDLLADGWSLADGRTLLLFDGPTGIQPFDNVLTDPWLFVRLSGDGIKLWDWVALGDSTSFLSADEIAAIAPARAIDVGDVLTVPVSPGTAAVRVYESFDPQPLWLAGVPVGGRLGVDGGTYPLSPGLHNPDFVPNIPEPGALAMTLIMFLGLGLRRQRSRPGRP